MSPTPPNTRLTPHSLFATLLLTAALLIGLIAPSLALAQSSEKPARHGLWIAGEGDGAARSAAPIVATRYQFEIAGVLARARVDQHFYNPTDRWVEAEYRFPLPEKAAIDHLVLRIDDRVVLGTVKEREEARKTYEKARAAGKAAALVEAERENVFTISVANIPPRAVVSVELGFDQPVDRAGLVNTLRLPLVVAPRYDHPIDMDEFFASPDPHAMLQKLVDRDNMIVSVRPSDTGLANPVHISVALKPGFVPSEIKSSTHGLKVTPHEEWFEAVIDKAVPADRDFELSWKAPAEANPRANIFIERDTDKPHAYIEILPPAEEVWQSDDEPDPRELTLIIDRSGSMSGTPIAQARAALLFALDHVRPQDRINVIAFDDKLSALFDEPRLADADTLTRARAFVNGVTERGGTEMWPALELALRGHAPEGYVRQVVIATDALIGYEAELLGKVEAARGDARIFPIAIGSAPNGSLIRWAADVGRGTAIFISKADEIETRMTEFLARIEKPALTDISVRFEGADAELAPAKPGDLFIGLPVTVSARLDHKPRAIIVSGKMGDTLWEKRFDTDQAIDAEPQGPVARLFGRRLLAEQDRKAMASYGDDAARKEAEKNATAIALEYGLLSRFTSLVAVDAEVIRPEGESFDHQTVQANPPHGASLFGSNVRAKMTLGTGGTAAQPAPVQMVSLNAPQTATPAQIALTTGLLLMLAGLIALYIALRKGGYHARS